MNDNFTIKEFKDKIMIFKDKKCKNCIFNTGEQCHGFGDYWASCKLLERILSNDKNEKIINKYNKDNNLNDLNKRLDIWYSLVNDETKCKLYELINKLNYDTDTLTL